MRADVELVARGLAPTRSAAQRLIAAGAVRVDRGDGPRPLARPSEDVDAHATLSVVADDELRWASRAGLKLEAAWPRAASRGAVAAGAACLDVGQSTGGFTDVLLSLGAARVVGVDVGHGQLLPRLAADERVAGLEGINARSLDAAALRDALDARGLPEAHWLPEAGYPLAVADLSFISLDKVLPAIAGLIAPGGWLLALVKPQFEAGRAAVGKGGIVKADPALAARIETGLRDAASARGLEPVDFFPCAVAGGDGNRESFLLARKRAADIEP